MPEADQDVADPAWDEMVALAAAGDWQALGLDSPDPATPGGAAAEPEQPFQPISIHDFLTT